MWTKNMEKKKTYPTLSKDIKTEIVIVGGGITGALTAHYFMKQGMKCVLVDKSNIATHATSASTAILKYEINQGLTAHVISHLNLPFSTPRIRDKRMPWNKSVRRDKRLEFTVNYSHRKTIKMSLVSILNQVFIPTMGPLS